MTTNYRDKPEGTRSVKEIIGAEVLVNLEELYEGHKADRTQGSFDALQAMREPAMRKCLADDRAMTMADWDFDGYFDDERRK